MRAEKNILDESSCSFLQKKYYPDIHDLLSLIQGSKEKGAAANKHGNVVQCKEGRAAISYMKMENPADHNGKIVYSDPVVGPGRIYVIRILSMTMIGEK